MKSIRAIVAGALAFGFLAVAPALAQEAGGDAGRPPAGPTDSKQYGDWLVRCFAVKSPSPCDMMEMLADKDSKRRVLSISIAYAPVGDRHVIVVAVPLGVLIQRGLVLSTDGYTSPMLHYRRCDRGGCYVELYLPPDLLSALSAGTAAKVTVYLEPTKPINLAFSLKGFNDAHGAMTDLARKKTGSAATPAAPAPAAPPPDDSSTPAPDGGTPSP